jgi:hypothetical protein
MTEKLTLEKVRTHTPKDVPMLEPYGMSEVEQDELLSEILGSQLRRRALSRFAPKPSWAQYF